MDQQDAEKNSANVATVTVPAATDAGSKASSEATQTASEAAAAVAAKSEPVRTDPPPTERASSAEAKSAGGEQTAACNTPPWIALSPGNRITLLAASLVLVAALGATAGAFAGYHLAPSAPGPVAMPAATNLAEIQALKENVVQARVELAAVKVSVDVGNRNAGTQFTRMSERIDRLDRAQAEPTAKLNKAIDTLDRLARDPSAQKDATGFLAQPNGPTASESPSALDRWVVRDVRRGAALIEGRMGLIEVVRGDVVPGLGRVAAIGKHDGRWIVITTKGLITSTR